MGPGVLLRSSCVSVALACTSNMDARLLRAFLSCGRYEKSCASPCLGAWSLFRPVAGYPSRKRMVNPSVLLLSGSGVRHAVSALGGD
jgi:hypothetical protein